MTYLSWGRTFKFRHNTIKPYWRDQLEKIFTDQKGSFLPYGLGRSYGDVCLNQDQNLIVTNQLNRILEFNIKEGTIRCEAGLCLADLLEVIVPQGWFVPVTPGTKFVTIGGMVANDIHGKNHHKAGTFGNHLLAFELLRSNGERIICNPDDNYEMFCATIGGMGLTGLITWVEFKLIPIESPLIEQESIKFGNLDEFFELSKDSSDNFDYTVSWLDCISEGKDFGRGIFMRGNHADVSHKKTFNEKKRPALSVPVTLPKFLLNRFSMQTFNTLYYRRLLKKQTKGISKLGPFFYPLDAVDQWNKVYGSRGFYQYQFVIPLVKHHEIKNILKVIAKSKQGSFLAVLKEFGGIISPGMMSFPECGLTLALDFPNHGAKTLKLLSQLDDLIISLNGRTYPAKDAMMSPEAFKKFYPNWQMFKRFVDPNFSSSFWRRVMGADSV